MARQKKLKKPKIVEVAAGQFEAIFQRAAVGSLPPEEIAQLRLLTESHIYLVELLKQKNVSLRRLQDLLFGASTEKTDAVLGQDPEPAPAGPPEPVEPKKKPKGHGRKGADDYVGAKRIRVQHETWRAGDPCPECVEGTLYDMTPGVLIRIVGQAPLQATVYELQKIRCNLCGTIFTAPPPEGLGPKKYDATSGSMIALLKYGTGVPFNRAQRLQGGLGIPLPVATQWDIVHAKAQVIGPAFQELIRQGAQGDILHNDDTHNRILEFMGKRARKAALQEEPLEEPAQEPAEETTDQKASPRTGLFTTGIVSLCALGRRVALFFTGRKHAGENLRDVLAQRAKELEPPIQMCDALSRNMPAELQTILANCLAHGRRNFVDIVDNFKEECGYVLEALKLVYQNDAEARQQQLSPETRLEFHQTHSRPVLEELRQWLERQIEERLVEPNSGLGQAISYLRRHWEKLTLFLRKAGAPLDNNLCERALKKIILHRKNSYFFLTQNGANVADLYMSLIYTCELNGANPFDYLNELELHAAELAAAPENWMPWNYRLNLEPPGTSPPSLAVPLPLPQAEGMAIS